MSISFCFFSRKRSAEVETQQQSWVVAFQVVSISFFAFDIFFKLPSEKMHEALQRENVSCAIMVFFAIFGKSVFA